MTEQLYETELNHRLTQIDTDSADQTSACVVCAPRCSLIGRVSPLASPGLAVSPSVSICVHLWCLFSAYFPYSAVNPSRQVLKFNVGMTSVLAFPSPGSAGGYPPAPPQTRTSGFPAYGSLSHGFAAPAECTIRALGR
jgi:hypothetical protein